MIQDAQFQGDHIIVTVFDKPAVAIIGMGDYNDYLERKKQRMQSQAATKRRAQTNGERRVSKRRRR